MSDDLLTRALARAHDAARSSREAVALPSLAEEPARPGDLLLHPALGAHPVHWVVVAAAAGGTARVLPADVGSLLGSGDVALAASATQGRLAVRCRFEEPLFPAALAGARRSGRLDAASLERIERRRAALATGREGTFTEVETDQDPEYQDWLTEVVAPACRAWRELGVAKVLPLRRREAPPTWLRLAAGLAAMVGLGALSGWWLEADRSARLEATLSEQQSARLTRERELREELEASAEAQKAAREAAGRELAALSEELRRARDAALIVNPVLASLEPAAAVRGEVKALLLPATASHLLLFLPVDSVVGGTLRLELSAGADGRLLWQKNPLVRQVGHEVSVGVPAALVPEGDLVLRLYRRERGKEELIREHHLRVERERAPARPRGLLP